MSPDTPPAAPSPSDLPPQPPPIEVRAEPVRPDDRGRVVDLPPPPSTPPPPPPTPPPASGAYAAGPGPVPPAGAYGAASAPPRLSSASSHAWAMACHLVGLIDFGFSFLLAGLLGSLVVWLIKKDEDPEVDFHGKEAINFQLNLVFWYLAGFPLLLCCGLGAFIWVVLVPAKIVLMIVAAVRAADGQRWSYPFIYRLLR